MDGGLELGDLRLVVLVLFEHLVESLLQGDDGGRVLSELLLVVGQLGRVLLTGRTLHCR